MKDITFVFNGCNISIVIKKNNQTICTRKLKYNFFKYSFVCDGIYTIYIYHGLNVIIFPIYVEKIDCKYLFIDLNNKKNPPVIFRLTDANYAGLPIEKGEINLWQQ